MNPLDNNNPLLRDAPGLKENLMTWLQDGAYCAHALEVMHSQQGLQPYKGSLFKDQVNYPAYSLVAYAQQKISLSQFTSIILQWSASQDYPVEYENVEYYQLPEQAASEVFRRFLGLSSSVFFNNNKISDEEFDVILQNMCAQNIPNSERQFSVLYFQDFTNVATIFCALKSIGLELFMPVVDDAKQRVLLIVPSFTILQTVCNVFSSNSVQLEPRIGETPTPDVGVMHEFNLHPFGISFPGYIHEKADGHDARRLGFAIHDVYHITILSFLPIKKALMELTKVAAAYVVENNIAADRGANFALDYLIDAEYSQYFHQRNLSTQYEPFDNESIIINGLLRLLFPEDLKLFYRNFSSHTSLTMPTQKQCQLFDHLFSYILSSSDVWMFKYGIDVQKMVNMVLCADDVIKPTLRFFSELIQKIELHFSKYFQDKFENAFLRTQRLNIIEIMNMITVCFEVMRNSVGAQSTIPRNSHNSSNILSNTATHQDLALIREAQFANMNCFYNTLFGVLSLNENPSSRESELFIATKKSISLFAKISPEHSSMSNALEVLLDMSIRSNTSSINDSMALRLSRESSLDTIVTS